MKTHRASRSSGATQTIGAKPIRDGKTVVGLMVIAVLALGCGAGAPNRPAGTIVPQTAGPTVTDPPGAASDAAPTATTSDAYGIGDRVRIGDQEFFVVLEVDLNVKNDGVFKPDAGNKWIAALVEIEGIDPNGASYNPFYFTLRDGDGFEYNFSAFGKDPALQSSNDLKPGKKVRGWVTFEVPKGATGLLLLYEAGFIADEVEVELD